MSVLVDNAILDAIANKEIVIEPFDLEALGTNSYDVHLGDTLRLYDDLATRGKPLDCRQDNPTSERFINPTGYTLYPGELYLASTVEYVESHVHVPMLNGKSSLGRLGLSIHVTAGSGDVGFCNHWTLEMTVVRPLRVYAGMPIGQLLWFTASGAPTVPYNIKQGAKYAERDSRPGASRMHRNFP